MFDEIKRDHWTNNPIVSAIGIFLSTIFFILAFVGWVANDPGWSLIARVASALIVNPYFVYWLDAELSKSLKRPGKPYRQISYLHGVVIGLLLHFFVSFMVSSNEDDSAKGEPLVQTDANGWHEGRALAQCSELLHSKLGERPNVYFLTKGSKAINLNSGMWTVSLRFDKPYEQLMNAYCEIYTTGEIRLVGISAVK